VGADQHHPARALQVDRPKQNPLGIAAGDRHNRLPALERPGRPQRWKQPQQRPVEAQQPIASVPARLQTSGDPPSYEAYRVKGGAQRRDRLQTTSGLASRSAVEQKSTSPHIRSAHQEPAPISRMHGSVCEARRDGTHLFDGIKALGGIRSTSILLRREQRWSLRVEL
jgi:hypothetical protein